MRLTVEEMIPEFQRLALYLDIGDITSHPREARVNLSKDEIIDLMVDAYHLGHKHGRRTAVKLVVMGKDSDEG